MPAYCFWNVREVHDQVAYDEYVATVTPTVHAHGGEYVVVGGPWQVVEGSWHPAFPVLIRFPSMDHAMRWYESDEYRPLRELRLGASEGDAVFMDSVGAEQHLESAADAVPA